MRRGSSKLYAPKKRENDLSSECPNFWAKMIVYTNTDVPILLFDVTGKRQIITGDEEDGVDGGGGFAGVASGR